MYGRTARRMGVALAALTACLAIAAGAALATGARARHSSSSRVIVLLRDEHRALPATPAHGAARSRALASDQRPLQAAVRASGGTVHQSFHTINAFAATVSGAERARLARDPAVAHVYPDALVSQPVTNPGFVYTARPRARSRAATPSPVNPHPGDQDICPKPGAPPLVEPEGLSLIHAPQAQALGVDGSGVKVAFFAEGIDPDNPDLVRKDGSKVIADYRDFSGEGPNAPTTGGEAFGDASTIAAQGNVTYDLSKFVNSAVPLPANCDMRLEGVAPGASLYAMKVFGLAANAFDSTILQGMDWAVSHDHVDILNESFGGDPLPDSGADQDLIKKFNDQAAAVGVTVTTSSGDEGTANVIGSPASDPAPNVLDVAATTQFQGIAQTVRGGYQLSNNGWVNNNIAEFSSGGFTQLGGTVDLAAPGNESFEACTPTKQFRDCIDRNGNPSNLSTFGGTSESAPMTAGVAAMMIQAYRETHGGRSPLPAQVKQIITSNADDLTIPSYEQGAGNLDAVADVQAAKSIDGGTPVGDTRLVSPTQLDVATPAGQTSTSTVQLTNSGAKSQTYSASLRQLGPGSQLSDTAGDLNLTPASDPTFPDDRGILQAYQKVTFTVPAGAQRIDAALAHPNGNATVNMVLVDPSGKYTAYTYHPQPDNASYSHIDVRNPPAGQWTAEFFTPQTATKDYGSYSGPVHYDISTSKFVSAGTVTPSSVTLAPGQSATLNVSTTAPATPGDYSRDVQISDGSGQTTAVPVVMRSLVPIVKGAGHFAGAITGGNGNGFIAREDTFSFDVPQGAPELGVHLTLANDPNTALLGFLVSPDGQTLGQDSVAVPAGAEHMQLFQRNPAPGRWRFVLATANPVGGSTVSGSFTGSVSLSPVPISSRTVLNGATVAAGSVHPGLVTVTNPGLTTLHVILDARRNPQKQYGLVGLGTKPPSTTVVSPLPLSGDTLPPEFAVPTETTGLTTLVHGSAPLTFDWGFGNPDLPSVSNGNDASGSFSSPAVTPGIWFVAPALQGPFDGPASGTARTSMTALTRAFDPSVVASTRDPLLADVDPSAPAGRPVAIPPGGKATMSVKITAQGHSGQTVAGDLFVDDYMAGSLSANELGSVPYSYTIR